MAFDLEGLHPEPVWRFFRDIASIPHGSGNEEQLARYVVQMAQDQGCHARIDAAGNVCIRVPASAGMDSAPCVVLQGHLDMVCEKNGEAAFDFLREGLRLERDETQVWADGTTLGADNGIGVAAALAAAFSPDVIHGPLELLFTVEEERGLTGAMDLDPALVTGKVLLNLDSERSGAVCVGCAGGVRISLSLPLSFVTIPGNYSCASIRLTGLQGGHSGLNIHENRGNALKLLCLVLEDVRGLGIRLCSISGGDKPNAIPREASAIVCFPDTRTLEFSERIHGRYAEIVEAFAHEAGMVMRLQVPAMPVSTLDQAGTHAVLDILGSLPNGVQSMSKSIPGMVESSNNLASAGIRSSSLDIQLMARSSDPEGIAHIASQVRSMAERVGASFQPDTPYPGWKPDTASALLRCVESVHERLFGVLPVREVTHAGLECGIIAEKCGGMDMVSIGPDIFDCHSPAERVSIAGVQKFWHLLCGVLENIAKWQHFGV